MQPGTLLSRESCTSEVSPSHSSNVSKEKKHDTWSRWFTKGDDLKRQRAGDRGTSPSPLVLPNDPLLLHQRDILPLNLRHESNHPSRDWRALTLNDLVSTD
ncbi:hypothetical protein CR513_43569, partial [Mucuna pruriens]